MPIVDRIKQLNFADGRFVVIGSGVMDALGLRDAGDIDLVVTPDYFAELKADPGWTIARKRDEEVLMRDDQEVWLSWGGDGTPNFNELYEGGVSIDGIRFANPRFVRDWKIKAARPKDAADVALLDGYLGD